MAVEDLQALSGVDSPKPQGAVGAATYDPVAVRVQALDASGVYEGVHALPRVRVLDPQSRIVAAAYHERSGYFQRANNPVVV